MVPSGNKDYIIIIIILWGIKDLSQPVSVALKNTSKSQHSVTKSIVQILKKKKKKKTLNPEKERFTSFEQGQYALMTACHRIEVWKNWVLEWCLSVEFSHSSSNSFLKKILKLQNCVYIFVSFEFICQRWQMNKISKLQNCY